MSSNSEVELRFTVDDHDRLKACAEGVARILDRMDAIDERIVALDKRMAELERWRVKVVSIAVAVGTILGFVIRVIFQK